MKMMKSKVIGTERKKGGRSEWRESDRQKKWEWNIIGKRKREKENKRKT